jgi:hypothetical protein
MPVEFIAPEGVEQFLALGAGERGKGARVHWGLSLAEDGEKVMLLPLGDVLTTCRGLGRSDETPYPFFE